VNVETIGILGAAGIAVNAVVLPRPAP